jgi:CRISPR-associated endonuclease/helicase Cas3
LETARRACNFAAKFGAGELAYYAGLWHDVGKFSTEFQAYLAQQGGRRSADHKTAGAVLAGEWCDLLAFIIAGHHGGMPCKPDLEARLQSKDRIKLAKLALEKTRAALPGLEPPGPLLDAFPAFLKDPQLSNIEAQRQAEFFIRMLFSALVDADYLDTERHFGPEQASARGGAPQLGDLWQRFQDDQQRLSGQGQDVLGRIRHKVYERCLEAVSEPPGIFRLTVPTGGGKTRSAMAFALKHALAHNMRRVIEEPAGYPPACWREESGFARQGEAKGLPVHQQRDIRVTWELGEPSTRCMTSNTTWYGCLSIGRTYWMAR